jgi:hypothetical protein
MAADTWWRIAAGSIDRFKYCLRDELQWKKMVNEADVTASESIANDC